MIVAHGTGLRRALRQFVLRNWALILLVVFAEEIVWYTSRFSDVLQTDVFSATAVGLLATVVGIFIVFRFNEAYQRWWEARILWGGLVNESRNFTREVMTFVTPERARRITSEQEAEEVQKKLVYRHLAYCNALRLSLRRQDSWEELTPFLSESDYEDIARYVNKPTRLTFLQARQLEGLFDTDVGQSILLTRLDATMNRLLDIQGGCERIKNTAFPDEVRFISKAMVWLSAIAIPIAFLSANDEIHALEVVAVVVISLSFMVVEQLGAALKNPFENLDNDTPMTALCRTIEIDLRQQLGETDVPPPMEPVDGVLM
jgi:putative membrane protein